MHIIITSVTSIVYYTIYKAYKYWYPRLVSANTLMAGQEGVKTPHRIELCEELPVRPTRNYRKRR